MTSPTMDARTTTDHVTDHASDHASDLAHVVGMLTQQVGSLTAAVAAMQERERWYNRRRLANAEQQLAVVRQITLPQLLDRIRMAEGIRENVRQGLRS